jgi:hypothetical protein
VGEGGTGILQPTCRVCITQPDWVQMGVSGKHYFNRLKGTNKKSNLSFSKVHNCNNPLVYFTFSWISASLSTETNYTSIIIIIIIIKILYVLDYADKRNFKLSIVARSVSVDL